MISETDAFILETAQSQGWLDTEQVAAATEASSQEGSSTASDFLISQGWLQTEHIEWLQQMMLLRTRLVGITRIHSKEAPPPEDSQAASDLASTLAFQSGSSRYERGPTVATGGMGSILQARDLNLNRSVAMKVMLSQSEHEKVLRFVDEAKITGRLEHPGIVPIYELGVNGDGKAFYTMKLVRGLTLESILESIAEGNTVAIERYPLGQLLTIFQKICDAVGFAHSRDVVHRDLKPANFMIGDYGEVLVMDWGLAKVLSAPSGQRPPSIAARLKSAEITSLHQTLEGDIIGTPLYMAPEQASGRTGATDARTDIYALGGILYHILTLQPPISGDTVEQAVAKIMSGEIVPAHLRHNPAKGGKIMPHCPEGYVPESLSAVAMKAMSVHPGNRYPSVKEFQQDIAAYQGGFATSAESASMMKQMYLLFKRHKTEAISIAVALVVLLVVVTFFVVGLTRERNHALAEKARATLNEKRALESEQRAKEEKAIALAATSERSRALEKLAKSNEERARVAESLVRANAERERAAAEHAKAIQEIEGRASTSEQRAVENEKLVSKMEKTALSRLDVVQATAPAFYDQARVLIDDHRFDDALEKIAYAIKIVPDESEYYVLKGNILQSLLRLKEARESYLEALRHRSAIKLASENIALCEKLLAENQDAKTLLPGSIQQLLLAMQKQERFSEAIAMLEHLNQNKTMVLSTWRAILAKDEVGILMEPSGRTLEQDENGLLSLDLHDLAIEKLPNLKGMPLVDLNLSGTKISNLGALKGLPLQKLNLSNTLVAEISVLRGMALTTLALEGTKVRDLAPLQGMPLARLTLDRLTVSDVRFVKDMPLTNLSLGNLPLKDISFLKGMQLTTLNLSGTKIRDIGPLKGMPLKMLRLDKCTAVKDLSPLMECRELERLVLPVGTGKGEILKKIPSLKYASYQWTRNEEMPTVDQFLDSLYK